MNYCDLSGQPHEKAMHWLVGGTTPKWFGVANTFQILLKVFSLIAILILFLWIWLDIFYGLTGQASKFCLVSMFWILEIKWIIWESWYVFMFQQFRNTRKQSHCIVSISLDPKNTVFSNCTTKSHVKSKTRRVRKIIFFLDMAMSSHFGAHPKKRIEFSHSQPDSRIEFY